MEKLDRGVVAIHQGGGRVYVGWRMLGPGDNRFQPLSFHRRWNPSEAEWSAHNEKH
ncbi:MAG: rhamnogalacturonan endolyase family protein [Planctomycetota bacterium]